MSRFKHSFAGELIRHEVFQNFYRASIVYNTEQSSFSPELESFVSFAAAAE